MKRLIILLLISILLVFSLTGCGGEKANTEEPQQVITLKMAAHYPIGHPFSDSSRLFAKRTEELSNGRLKVEYYPAEQLGKLQDQLQFVSDGMADIAVVPTSIFAGQLPLNTVMQLPFYSSAVEGAEIIKRLHEAVPELEQEFTKYGIKTLFYISPGQYDVATAEKPVRSPEDLKGIKIATAGGMFSKIAAKYGINPVNVSVGDYYEATQRGIVDGHIQPITAIQSYRLDELVKYQTYGLRMGGTTQAFAINLNSWQKLPDDLQKILLQAGEESRVHAVDLWDKKNQMLIDEFQKKGITIYTVKPEDRAKWEAPLKGLEQDWINDMNQKGLPGQKVFDEFYKISKEVAK